MTDLLIQNAAIADGSGEPAFFGDIAVHDGRIREIRRHDGKTPENTGNGANAAQIVDAVGLTAVPGFIDIHRHGDLAPFGSGEEAEELRQGITFFVNGNCGFSPFPSRAEFFSNLQNYARSIIGGIPPQLCGFGFAAFRRELEQRPLYSSMAYLSGGGALRIAVKGFDPSPLTAAEMDTLLGLLKDDLDAGTFGLSLGLMYIPEYYYATDELVKICRIPARQGRPVTVHMRQEGNGLPDSVEQVINLARQSGAAFHISHLKAAGRRNWGKNVPWALERIAAARQEGLDITFDAYPYDAGSTALYTLLPPDCQKQGLANLLESLRQRETRRAIAAELREEQTGWDNLIPGIGWKAVVIAGGHDAEGRPLAGRSVEEIAGERDCPGEDCVFDLLLENNGNVPMVIFSMHSDDVERILSTPGVIVISDAVYSPGGLPHPRRFGAQARFLSRYADAPGFEQALRSVTALPAERFGLHDRGLLREGAVADIVLLCRSRFRDTATWENPVQYPQGIAGVFVAGRPAFTETEGLLGKYGSLVVGKT